MRQNAFIVFLLIDLKWSPSERLGLCNFSFFLRLTGLKLGKSSILCLRLILSCHLSSTCLTAAEMATSAAWSGRRVPGGLACAYASHARLGGRGWQGPARAVPHPPIMPVRQPSAQLTRPRLQSNCVPRVLPFCHRHYSHVWLGESFSA